MALIVLAFIIGVVAGLRAMTAPAAISWAARLGRLHLEDTWLAFLGFSWTPWILSIAALGELVNDKLPGTASRKTPPQFIARILSGSLCGAAIGASLGGLVIGLLAGALGSVAGTLGGAEARSRLVKATGGKDWPIAVLEDVVAVVTAFLVARCVS